MEDSNSRTAHIPAASGEKAKARDIINAIRTLKRVEEERRQATADERQALGRFGGFGAVALSLFPDPVKGSYKDGWQALGEELHATPHARGVRQRQAHDLQRLLHIADCDSGHAPGDRPPRRVQGRNRPRARLWHRELHEPCPRGDALHRRRAGFRLRPHRTFAAPRSRHPHRKFPRNAASRGPDRRGDRQSAVRRRQVRAWRAEAAVARLFHRQIDRRIEARRRPGRGDVAFHFG